MLGALRKVLLGLLLQVLCSCIATVIGIFDSLVLSLVLFVVFVDMISGHSQDREAVLVEGLKKKYLLLLSGLVTTGATIWSQI